MRRAAILAACTLVGVPATLHAVDAPAAGDWVTVTSLEVRAGGRHLELAVREQVDPRTRIAGWMLDACLVDPGLPTTCLSHMPEAEQLEPGRESAGRTFVIRALPTGHAAWVVSTRWSQAGIELEATRMDLRGLVGATTLVGDHGQPEVQVSPEFPVVPTEPTRWSSRSPQPDPQCVPLSVDVHPAETGVDIDVRPASETCTGWRLRHDMTLGTWIAHPLAGYATPDLLAELTGTESAKPAAPAARPPEAQPAATSASTPSGAGPARRHGRCALSSFSRR